MARGMTYQSGYTKGGDLEKNHVQVTSILRMRCRFSLLLLLLLLYRDNSLVQGLDEQIRPDWCGEVL